MEDYPKTIAEFESRFRTEDACHKYLYKLRWPDGFACPRCQSKKSWLTERGLLICSACGYHASLRAGTIFQSSRKPLKMWFRAIWWVTSQKTGASALGLQRVLGLGGYQTAWTWLHKLRRAMVRPGRDRLTGIVEVDETYIGGEKPGKRGRGAEGKSLVLVAAQKDGNRAGRIRLRPVPDASAESLEPAVIDAIEPGTVIHTDGWSGYSGLKARGYGHDIVRLSASIGEELLPLAHRVSSLLKRWLMGTHQGAVSHEHLDYYLDEFTFRFNRRTSQYRGKLFYRLVQQAVNIDPVPYGKMIKHVRGLKPKKHNI